MSSEPEFDRFAVTYDSLLAATLSGAGDDAAFYAQHKRGLIERLLGSRFDRPILDFGCGVGNLTTLLGQAFPHVHGFDPSQESVKLAQVKTPSARFFHDPETIPQGVYGAVVLANVLHHVVPRERAAVMKRVVDCLAPGGRAIIFEHNPFNPVTRKVVADCPFDENAVLLYPRETKRLLRNAGLQRVALDYVLFFPHPLTKLRFIEKGLTWLPLGAQVCAWATKP